MSIDNYVNGMSEGSQRRGSVKDKVYKRPVSILVVIYAQDTKPVSYTHLTLPTTPYV